MKRIKTRIATAATIVGLGGLAGVALNAADQGPGQQLAAKPLVRTKVIRRTIHVTKHAKPRHPVVASPPASGPSSTPPVTTGSSGAGSEEPVTTSSSGAVAEEPVTTSSSGGGGTTPVTTSSSGGGSAAGGEVEDGGGIEHEAQGGADD